ncbi:MAG: hypothetical protein M3Y87_12665 [Myxococcota bacterium]|nr:hypothetical protein [Myxococcota bacterium]
MRATSVAMTERDDVEAVLAIGELAVAQALIDAELKALERASKGTPTALTPVLRRRAILAEESSIDDDLPSLVSAAKRMGDAAAQPDADDEDRARWAWGLLMANATGKARKAGAGDPMLRAGLAYAAKPTDERRAALFAASEAHPERAIRLVVQRSEPAVEEARRLYESRAEQAPLPDRHTLRALRLAVAAMRSVADPAAETLHRLDPEHGLSPEGQLALRRERLAKIEAMFGSDSELLLQPYFSLSSVARDAGAMELSVEALLRVDALLAKRRGEAALLERHALLGGLMRDLIALDRIDEAAEVVQRYEAVLEQRGLDVPAHTARAEICKARGDWDGYLEELRLHVVQARESKHPAYGPESNNLRLAESWLEQGKARAAKARG